MFSKKKSIPVHITIEEHTKDVKTCLVKFESFMQAATMPETARETLRALADDISVAEAKADISLRNMIDSLGGDYLPSTRESLISLATRCDKIANKCESASHMVVLQRCMPPAKYRDELLEIVSITISQFDLLKKSIFLMFSDLRALLKDHSILDEIRKLESSVDHIETKLLDEVFGLEIGLAERMQLANLINSVCDLSDVIEDIADRIQIMLITRKA